MITLLAALVGGFAGAIARQEGFSALQERARTSFPVGILAVNLSGAFVLGLLFGLGVASAWPRWVAAGVQAGFIGAYTTYSTWAVDSLTLARDGTPGWPCSTWPDRCWLVSCSPGAAPASARC
jgi:fluoride exporter